MPLLSHSIAGQAVAATAAASVVVMNALAAIPSAATALPALKPYQPTHSMPVPTIVSTRLCGEKLACRSPLRLPEDQAEHQRRPARRHVNDRPAGEVDGVDAGAWRSRRRS